MKADAFDKIVEEELQATVDMLKSKASEYATGEDRLSNFKTAAALRGVSPADALMGMLAKHMVSVADMVKTPNDYTPAIWDEKLRDVRNYTILLKGVLIDMGVMAGPSLDLLCPFCDGRLKRELIPIDSDSGRCLHCGKLVQP